MFDFDSQLSKLSGQTVLCVGDLMLDDFVYGEVVRISPEAPAPVIAVKRNEMVIGGAGNVARNVASLGAHCIFVGVVGDDEVGRILAAKLRDEKLIEAHLAIDPARPTSRKVRFVSEHYSTHLLRADWELAKAIEGECERDVINHALDALPRVGAVILSDYAKGVLTANVIHTILDAAKKAGKPVIVDPKINNMSIYRGATLITPNKRELAEAVRRELLCDADIVAAADELCDIVASEAVLVTRSDEGMTLVQSGHEPIHVSAYPVKIGDVSGAGDTVVAVLAAMLASKSDFEPAMRAANAAAAVVVGKRGTASVTLAELRSRILPAASLAAEEKVVFDWSQLDERLADWRRQGLRVGFTNGCFDLLHPGHIRLLTQARATCDRLIVGLNGDPSVTRLKGHGRPVQNQHARADVLAALEAVDLVVIFEEDTPLKLIDRLRPKVLIKGSDYRRDEVVGGDIVEANGGEVVLVEIVPGHSTTEIVHRSRVSGRR